MNLAVFASGSGTNFKAIVDATRNGDIEFAEVKILVCDNKDAYVIKRAEEYGIEKMLSDKNIGNFEFPF